MICTDYRVCDIEQLIFAFEEKIKFTFYFILFLSVYLYI